MGNKTENRRSCNKGSWWSNSRNLIGWFIQGHCQGHQINHHQINIKILPVTKMKIKKKDIYKKTYLKLVTRQYKIKMEQN